MVSLMIKINASGKLSQNKNQLFYYQLVTDS